MKFTNEQDYREKRQALIDKAQNLLNEGKVDEANEIIKNEIPEMDKDFENVATARANLAAMTGTAPVVPVSASMEKAEVDYTDSIDYRNAFKNYVLTGEEIPAQFKNADAVTKTTDVGAVIPTTLMEKIIEKMESIGTILPLVTQTGYKGGVSLPKSTAKPVAEWVAEGKGSTKQKALTGTITFGAFKLRCDVAMTVETKTMALPIFEKMLVKNVSEAMVKALEQAIVNGSGNGQPKGIITEAAPEGQTIGIAAGDDISYDNIVACDDAMPAAYENGAVWLMTKKTFNAMKGIKDSQKRPIFTEVMGSNGKPQRMIYGYPVIQNDYMESYAKTVSADTTVAVLFKMPDYILNSNMQLTIKKYEDNDTDDEVTKAIMLADGKVVDNNSLVKLVKKAADA